MSKKQKVDLSVFDNLLGGEEPQESNEHVEASAPTTRKKEKPEPRGEDYENRTFRVRKEFVQKLRIISTREGRLQKDILDFALENVIARYEEKHGVIDISKTYSKKSLEDIF